jgi:hypothetical protein
MNERLAMLALEVRNGSQPAETLRLSRKQPIGIGRHASNDVCIDDAEVAPIHCRIAWNGSEFEVASAIRDGVDLNGTLVRHSALKVGDVLRIGQADLVVHLAEAVHDGTAATGTPALMPDDSLPLIPDPRSADDRPVVPSGEVPLSPVTEEQLPAYGVWDRAVVPARRWASMGERIERGPANAPAPGASPAPVSSSQAIEAILTEEEDEESNVPVAVLPRAKVAPLTARLSERLARPQVRPGEQEALRSPVILGMLGVTLALGLAVAAIYFVIGRESTKQEFDAATAEFDAKHYGQAAEMFKKFIAQHGGHKLAADAHYQMWNALILKEIGGGSPAWKGGLETVEQSIDANRDRKDFREHNAELVSYLIQIALGASTSAQNSADRSLLDVSSAAEAMLPRYFPDGKLPADLSAKLRAAFSSAQEAIIKHDIVTASLADLEKQNAARQPMAALATRRALLARYPEMAGDARLPKLLTQTLDVEKSLVVREEVSKPAIRRQKVEVPPAVTLTMHTRSHSEEPAGTRPVFVVAKDCLYAVDHATGEPMWRRSIGLDTPFFPLRVETSAPALLLFNSSHLVLMLIDRRNGEPIWEQPINEAVSGLPLVDQGQIYLGTAGRHLYKIDLESGRITTRLTFSQNILSPPALTRNKERLIVAGDASVIYTLTTSPLGCIRVNDIGYAAGSLVNGVTSVGGLVLLTEPGRGSGTRLHVFDAQSDETWLKPVDVQTVEGQVRDAPVIYGKTLFVASEPARISAFAVSDTPGQESLTPTTSLSIPKQQDSPIFLTPGPDGQLWMAGSSVRQLQLKLNSQTFSLNAADVAVGISSQPLQVVGQYLYAARRLPYSASVFFSEIDREPMTGQWRTVFGSSIIGTSVFSAGDIVTVGEAGDVFSLRLGDLMSPGFKSVATSAIEPDPGTERPLRATRLHDGKLAVDSAGPSPKLWLVGPGGQMAGSFALERPLEAPPIEIDAGLVLALPGRLRLANPTNGTPGADDRPVPIEDGKAAQWKAVERISDKDLVALDSRGRLSLFQFRTDPVRNLAEVVTKQVDPASDSGVVVTASRIASVEGGSTLQFREAATLEPVAAHKLPAAAVGRLWTSGTLVLVETRDHHLAAFDATGPTKALFVVPLGETGPAGAPAMIGGRLVVANRDGTILSLDPAQGTIIARASAEQPLSGGVIVVDGHPIVSTIDGSLVKVDSVLESAKKNP